MRKAMVWMVVIGMVLVFGGVASAQQKLIESVAKGCDKELKTYCKDVTPGEGHPPRDPVLHVLTIGVHHDLTGLFQRFQSRRRRCQFHPVVRRRRVAARQRLLHPAEPQDRRPTPRARIGPAAAIGPDFHPIVRCHKRARLAPSDGSATAADIPLGPCA